MNRERVQRAIAWAGELHAGQTRKGSPTPYLFHLLAVAALVADHGGTEDEIVAALLHDAIEDAGGRALGAEIARRFGEDVAGIVVACSDSDTTPKPPWRSRKEAFVASLADAPPSVRLVIAADKLHNSASTVRDLRTQGPGVWSRFRGGKEGTLWYYGVVLEALGRGWNHAILEELAASVAALCERAGDPA